MGEKEWGSFFKSYMDTPIDEKQLELFEVPDINASDSVKKMKLFNRLKSYRSGDKKRSKYTGVHSVCDWTPLEFREAILSGKCDYCGDTRWNILGLDRLDNKLGHTKKNTVISCRICNSIKGNETNGISYTKMKTVGKIIKYLKQLDLDFVEGKRILRMIRRNMYPMPDKNLEKGVRREENKDTRKVGEKI